MIDAAAKQMADQFFGAFRAHLAPVDAGASAPADPGQAVAPPASHAPDAPMLQPTPAQAHAQPAAAQAGRTEQFEPAADSAAREWLRVKWFALGALATALGVWIGARL
jgi:hypothetical protein